MPDIERRRARWRQYYNRHRGRMLAMRREKHVKLSAFVTSLKTQCARCGNADPRVIDFHHTNDDKESAVAKLRGDGASKTRILAEVAKCVQLCANCHRIHHWEQHNDATR